jgi:hypothetical protein
MKRIKYTQASKTSIYENKYTEKQRTNFNFFL